MIELDRIHFDGGVVSMRHTSDAMDRLRKDNPTLDVSWTHDLEGWSKTHKIRVVGHPKIVLPIKAINP